MIFAQFPRYFRLKKRLLVLAHREELLDQALAKFRYVDPNPPVVIEQAGRTASRESKVVLASVTVGRELASPPERRGRGTADTVILCLSGDNLVIDGGKRCCVPCRAEKNRRRRRRQSSSGIYLTVAGGDPNLAARNRRGGR